MTTADKDVIYIDADDEITAIIDRVTDSRSKIIALVLPKRATVLQSIVNMKLLKRSGDAANKRVVLITNEAGILPLAGAVGMYVAKTPQSKPEIPAGPADVEAPDSEEITEADMAETEFDVNRNAEKSIGELAGEAPEDDEPKAARTAPVVAAATAAKQAGEKPKKGKDKKLKVPNFGTFRNRLILGGVAAVALIGFLIYAMVVMPRATIAIGTDSEEITQTLDVTFDATADAVDVENVVVPSVVERIDRTDSETVAATGERNDGDTARGSVVMTSRQCPISQPDPVPAGTGVSVDGLTFITQETARFNGGNFDGEGCFIATSSRVLIIAEEPGAKYNVDDETFRVAGRQDVSAEGSADGGTDKITKVVSEEDIKRATEALENQNLDVVRAELEQRLQGRSLYVIPESLAAINPEVTADAKAGDVVEQVKVTRKTTYSMVGVREDDLNALIAGSLEDEIDPERQKVLNSGLSEAVFQLQNQQNNAAQVLMSMNTTSLIGPEINDERIKEQVVGMKAAEAEMLIGENPGVTSVEVTYGPFWVSSIPNNPDKITITHEN